MVTLMQYLGGKARQAKTIVDCLPGGRRFIEPFVGGGSVAARAVESGKWEEYKFFDAHPDLILMWRAAAFDGWTPPSTVSESRYAELKHSGPSPERGFVGFGCSFGGRFFEGYARNKGSDESTYAGRAGRSLIRKLDAIKSRGLFG